MATPLRATNEHPAPAFRIEPVQRGSRQRSLRFHGRLTFAESTALWDALRKQSVRAKRGDSLDLDLSDAELVDGGAMALLTHVRAELVRRGARCEFVGASERVQELVHLYRGDIAVKRRRRRKPLGLLDQLGRATIEILGEAQRVLAFLGEMLLAALALVRKPRTANWKELAPTMERAGADAVPIVLLINLLLGMVMAMQAAAQLKRFGAEIFVADLIGLSMAREVGPLMTAIIVTGRSGAAFAAELGSMRTNEEIDALRTMGFDPMRYLVLPRALALILVLPLLVLFADAVGIAGGLVVATTSLDLTPAAYWSETQKAVHLPDLTGGMIKSAVFALAIALISSQQGLAATGGAEGVGRRTTSAVVVTLFTLILIDAVFTLLLRAGGL